MRKRSAESLVSCCAAGLLAVAAAVHAGERVRPEVSAKIEFGLVVEFINVFDPIVEPRVVWQQGRLIGRHAERRFIGMDLDVGNILLFPGF